jgi:hypothetical protein
MGVKRAGPRTVYSRPRCTVGFYRLPFSIFYFLFNSVLLIVCALNEFCKMCDLAHKSQCNISYHQKLVWVKYNFIFILD